MSIQNWSPQIEISLDMEEGAELLVLEGQIMEGGDTLTAGSWLRLPLGSTLLAKTGAKGAKLWLKRGHLARVEQEIARLPSEVNHSDCKRT